MSETWLLIETSGRGGQVGLAQVSSLIATAELDPARRHNRDLAPTVDRLLRDAALRPRDLAGVMVSQGPGSYTGLRVGIMSAKVFAYATQSRLVAVPTFAALAECLPETVQKADVIADALQGLIYTQCFRRDASGVWATQTEMQIERLSDWLSRRESSACVTGPGQSLIPESDRASLVWDQIERRTPPLEALFRVGLRLDPVCDTDLFKLEPLYLRGSSAEEKARQSAVTSLG